MYQNIHKMGNSVPVKRNEEDSLVVQRLRICLTVQGTCVRAQLGKIPHAVGQQSPCTTTTLGAQPVLHKSSRCSEKPTHYSEERPPPGKEKECAQQETQHSQK